MEKFNTVPITLLTGYLGSGKTTLINHILANAGGRKMAVIVNDIGEVNIDADLIANGGVVSAQDENLVALQNGCICCTLKKDLINQLADLVNSGKFDHILIEASGICEPLPIAQTICYMQDEFKKRRLPEFYKLDAIVSVTDALRLADEFGCGESLEHAERGEEDVENLIIQQIEFCDVIILNKVSDVTKEQLRQIKVTIRALQPKAKIIEVDYAKVDLDEIVDTNLFDFEKAITSSTVTEEFERRDNEVNSDEDHDDDDHDEHEHHHHHHHDEDEHEEHEHHHHHHDDDEHEEHEHHHHHHHHHEHGVGENDDEGTAEEYGISTYVYYRHRPFDRKKFEEWASQNFGRKIIRAKGVAYFSNEMDIVYLYESSGKQKTLSEYGRWYSAGMTRKQIERELKTNEEFRKQWDDVYGDRIIKLVFIGQEMDKAELKKQLDNI